MKRTFRLAAGLASILSLVLVASVAAQTSPSAVPPPPPITPGAVPTALESIIPTTATAPVNTTVTVSTSSGGVVVAGNAAISLPPGAFAGISGNVTVTVTAQPSVAGINLGGSSQFSPNGTVLDVSIINQSTGQPITTFPTAVTIVVRPNPADLGIANGNFALLTMFYVIDPTSPSGENPNGYPVNTRVVVPPSAMSFDPANGFLSANLNFIGSVLGVGTNPVGYVQTTNPNAQLISSFDTSNAKSFGTEKQFSYLQVTEPAIGDTLMVLNPATGNYAYVKASDVGPSGPPPSSTSTAVVRGLLGSL